MYFGALSDVNKMDKMIYLDILNPPKGETLCSSRELTAEMSRLLWEKRRQRKRGKTEKLGMSQKN